MAQSTLYRVTFKPTAQRELRKLDPPVIKRILQKIERLKRNPRPPGVKKLQDIPGGYRLRVGDWRILYTVDDPAREVHVYRIKHRREAYRRS